MKTTNNLFNYSSTLNRNTQKNMSADSAIVFPDYDETPIKTWESKNVFRRLITGLLIPFKIIVLVVFLLSITLVAKGMNSIKPLFQKDKLNQYLSYITLVIAHLFFIAIK